MTEVDIENQVDKAHDGGEGEKTTPPTISHTPRTGLSKEDEHAMEELLQESKQSLNAVCNGKTDDVRGRFGAVPPQPPGTIPENQDYEDVPDLESGKGPGTDPTLVNPKRIWSKESSGVRSQELSDAKSMQKAPQYNSFVKESRGSHLSSLASETESFPVEEDMSNEQLQMIKARTMYEMVEEIESHTAGSAPMKLLFLSNQQAEFLASSPHYIQKMLDALDLPKPKLVINVLRSQGFRESTKRVSKEKLAKSREDDRAGFVYGHPPFVSYEEEERSLEMINNFMSEVLIPLAAQTNAVIVCSGDGQDCILSTSLTSMYATMRAQWGHKAPFSILDCVGDVSSLYCNPDLTANWREIRRSSKTWRLRHQKLLELIHQQKTKNGKLPECKDDLDARAMCYIIVDGISKREKVSDKSAFNLLMTETLRHLSSTLPSITIKTGNSGKVSLQNSTTAASSLGVALESMLSGSPLLFLDTRSWPTDVTVRNRAELIAHGKATYSKLCDDLLGCKPGLADTLDTMAVAYFHMILCGMGSVFEARQQQRSESPTMQHGPTAKFRTFNETKAVTSTRSKSMRNLGLHEAIRVAQSEGRSAKQKSKDEDERYRAPASNNEVSATASWLAHRFFQDAWKVLPDWEEREARGETYRDLWEEHIQGTGVFIKQIICSPDFHSVNLHDMETTRSVVNRLVRLDRLPKENPLEGLELLKESWGEYDVAMMFAANYKKTFKMLFGLQLLLTWLVVLGSTMVHASGSNGFALEDSVKHIALEVVFVLSVLATMMLTFESLLNAKNRWRQLRSSSGALESIIWQYRTRVGYFEIDPNMPDSHRPEAELRNALNEWRDDLVAGAELASSNLKVVHPPSTYRHYQFEGNPGDDEDNHHSPMKPRLYITHRIEPQMDFFQSRIPIYTRHRFVFKVIVMLLGASTAVLSRYSLVSWVVAVASLSSAVTSWIEFCDSARKVERYTRAITSLQKLLSWWKSLTEVERASTENISMLVVTSESIIAQERLAWVSTARKKQDMDESKEGKGTSAQVANGREENSHSTGGRRPTVAWQEK